MKPSILAAVIIGGFAIGAGLSSLWRGEAPALDMTTRALESFERACLPGAMGEAIPAPEVLGLTATKLLDGGDPIWIDPQAGALLRLGAGRCTLRIVEPDLVDQIDMDALGRRLAAMLATDMPALKREKPDDLGWPYFEAWVSGARGSDDRWGVLLGKTSDKTPPSEVVLSVTYPAD